MKAIREIYNGYYRLVGWLDASSGKRLHPILVPFLKRLFLQPSNDDELVMLPYFQTAPDGVFVDVGANKGQWTKQMLKMGRRVIAFEPNPAMKKHLKNLSKDFYPFALGDEAAFLKLARHTNPGLNGFIAGRDDPIDYVEVRVLPLDFLYLPKVGLIKIDTEGFEMPVIRGARKTIMRDSPRLIVELHGNYQDQEWELRDFLTPLDYSLKVLHFRKSGQPHVICDHSA